MNERENYYDSGDGRFVLLSGSGDNLVSESPVWILYKCLLWNIYYIILIIFLACNMKSFVDDLSIRMAIKDSSPKSLKTCKIVEKISFVCLEIKEDLSLKLNTIEDELSQAPEEKLSCFKQLMLKLFKSKM